MPMRPPFSLPFSVPLFVAVVTLAMTPSTMAEPVTDPLWAPAQDGSFVINRKSGLVWLRCVEGMHWDGKTCAGEALLLAQKPAIARAKVSSRTLGADCRLPSLGELQALVNSGAFTRSGGAVLFADAPSDWRWTSSPVLNTGTVNQYNYGNIMQGRNNDNAVRVDVLRAWAVNVTTGATRSDVTKVTEMPVQLVCRISQ